MFVVRGLFGKGLLTMEMSQEARWAIAARQGDETAFAKIVQCFQAPVYRLCARHLHGPEADDVAQETFVRAFVNMKRFAPDRPLLPWLLTIARNLALDRLRRRYPEPDSMVVDKAADTDHASAETCAASREQMRALEQALAKLPEPQREVIVLFHLEGLAYRDIAISLGVPIGTVMTWLHRGRAVLRQALLSERLASRTDKGVSP